MSNDYIPTIALDFDGVLHKYDGWNGGNLSGPVPGASEAVQRFLLDGYGVKIYSTRDAEVINGWLKSNGFPAVEVSREKPLSIVLVDDRAHRFDGKWDDKTIEAVESFKAYWERK